MTVYLKGMKACSHKVLLEQLYMRAAACQLNVIAAAECLFQQAVGVSPLGGASE